MQGNTNEVQLGIIRDGAWHLWGVVLCHRKIHDRVIRQSARACVQLLRPRKPIQLKNDGQETVHENTKHRVIQSNCGLGLKGVRIFLSCFASIFYEGRTQD